MAAVFLYFWIALSCFLLNLVAGQLECSRTPKPVFMSTETELEADEKKSLTLPCVFYNVTGDFQIYWYAGTQNIYWNDSPQTGSVNYDIDYSPTNPTRSSNLTIKVLSTYDSMTYKCRVSASECKVQAEFNVIVNYAPIVYYIGPREPPFWSIDEPDRIFVNETDNITLRCNASGRPAPFFTWVKMIPNQPEPEELSAGTEDTKHGVFMITNVSRTQSGDYRCQATNRIGPNFGYVELVVQYVPELTGLPSDIRAAPGASVTFGCDVIANPKPFDFYWMKDGLKLSQDGTNPTPNTFVILKLDPKTDYGNYTCVVTNQVGISSATVEVSGRPLAPVIMNSDPQGIYRHTYNLTWSPVSKRENSSRIINIPVARYIIKYQRKDIQNRMGTMVTVLWPNEALSETVQGIQEYLMLRDLKENSSYVGRVCPESDYGRGDCVSYTFTTSAVDFQPPPSPEIGYSGKCSNPSMCVGTWTPPSSSAERHSTVAMVTFTAGFMSWLLT
eukprot:XP_011666522.1 PREDICTED: MAM domain-containing glycosylphosphatidylinositol anchor protein 1-like [Strongylocentrotus purpuratus]